MNKLMCIVLCVMTMVLDVNAQEWKVNKGDQVPTFEIIGKNNHKVTTDSLKGKVVLLNFFATWCPPCRMELPRLQKELWDELSANKEFDVLVLAREEGWDKLDPFLESHKYTFPVYPDLKREVFGLFADQSIPRNVVLDRSGKIIYQSIGYEESEFSKMVELIKAELQKK